MKKYSNLQYKWIRIQYLTESVNLTHHIFDELIDKTWKWVLGAIIKHDTDETEPEFSGFVYDSKNQRCIETDDNTLYHPIYYQFEWDVDEAYEAYVPTRVVSGKSKEVLEYDSIIIHFNLTRIVENTDFARRQLIAVRVPSLMAHELAHVRDMWSVDFINCIDNLVDLGYNGITRQFFEEEGFTNIPDSALNKLYAMMYFMSPAETRAKYEEFDKFLHCISTQEIRNIIKKSVYKTDKRFLAAEILTKVQNIARVNISRIALNVGYEEYVKDVVEHNDFTIPVLFTAYCVYTGHIPDKSGYFVNGFDIARDIIEHRINPDDNLIKMMRLAYEEFEIQQGRFITDIEDIIIDYIDENHLMDNLRIDESEFGDYGLLFSDLLDMKLSINGNIGERKSTSNERVNYFLVEMSSYYSDVHMPYRRAIMESEYAEEGYSPRDVYEFIE